MSDWVHKIKEEAKGFVAQTEQEFTVLEGVDGIDPLDKRAGDADAHDAETDTATEAAPKSE